MTTPAEPDTGAGAEPDTGSAPDTATDTQTTETVTDTIDWQAEAEKYKSLARKHEQRAKDNKRALDQANTAKAGEPSIEDLQAQLADRDTRIGELEESQASAAYERAVNRAAREAGADAEALLDSSAFLDDVRDELGEDFDDDDLAKAVAKVAKVYAKKPRFATEQRPARSGADITGGPGTPRQITEDELHKMTPEQIVEAQDKGLLRNLLGG